mgnify:CR=1 FL=1
MNTMQAVLQEVKKAVSGKDEVLLWILTAILAKGHILLEDIPGVGKTTLAREFAEREYRSFIFIFIDFFTAPDVVRGYFEDYRDDMQRLLSYLSAYYDTDLHERDSLVVFDEVQFFPLARGLLKYLVEDGRYDFLETGSLLSIRRNVEGIVIPSEEERVALDPMDFEEFLWAMGEGGTARLLRAHYDGLSAPDQGLHRRAMRLWRECLLVGGMPKAVDAYVSQRSFEAADFEKRAILDLYRSDVSRLTRGYEAKVSALFDRIPGQLSKHEKKFTLASVGKRARMRSYKDAFYWLQDARVANLCFRADDPSVGLALSKERASLKCYMADTGLLVTHAFSDAGRVSERTYRSLLIDDIGVNEGMLVENAVAQTLVAKGDRLFFYSQSGLEEGGGAHGDRLPRDAPLPGRRPQAEGLPDRGEVAQTVRHHVPRPVQGEVRQAGWRRVRAASQAPLGEREQEVRPALHGTPGLGLRWRACTSFVLFKRGYRAARFLRAT